MMFLFCKLLLASLFFDVNYFMSSDLISLIFSKHAQFYVCATFSRCSVSYLLNGDYILFASF